MNAKNKKKVIFYIGHPAHYHNISNLARKLKDEGHVVLLVVRPKDVLRDLLNGIDLQTIFLPEPQKRSVSKIGLTFSVLGRELRMLRIVLKFRPDMMLGTDIVITHIGKLLGIPAFILNEDDASEVPFLADFGFRYSTATFSPISCNIGKYSEAKIAYPGYHELAYLGPGYFTPDIRKVQELVKDGRPYFILRFAELLAHHDKGKKGINDQLAAQVIDRLKPHGNVYITSERRLPGEFEQFRIKIAPADMHHALYFAGMYIGDSQTMAAEAAILGTPSIRYNDFVGKLGYLEELEHKWVLTKGIRTSDPAGLLNTIDEYLHHTNIKELWNERRQKMLLASVDLTGLLHWFIVHYPESMKLTRSNKEFYKAFLFKM